MLTMNYTYRIYPDAEQEAELLDWLETCRRTYNYALRELKEWIASRKCMADRCSLEKEYIISASEPFPSYHRQQNNLPKAKKKFPRLNEVYSQVLQTTIRRLHDSWDAFQKRGFGFPRFKKYGQFKSIVFPLLTASDGSFQERPKFFRSMQSQLKLLQRRAARKKKRSNNWEKAQIEVARMHNRIAKRRKDFHLKAAHQLCDQAPTIFAEDLNVQGLARGMLRKDCLDASFGQFLSLTEWVCWKRGVYFEKVNPNGTSQTCPSCLATVRKDLGIREHHCPECGYQTHRDHAAAEMVLHRGIESVVAQGLCGTETVCQVGLSGVYDLDKWRRIEISGAEIPNREVGKPALYA